MNSKKNYKKFCNGEWEYILSEINSRNYLKGKIVNIVKVNEIINGKVDKIAQDGRLEVEVSGKKRFFDIGEVHINRTENETE